MVEIHSFLKLNLKTTHDMRSDSDNKTDYYNMRIIIFFLIIVLNISCTNRPVESNPKITTYKSPNSESIETITSFEPFSDKKAEKLHDKGIECIKIEKIQDAKSYFLKANSREQDNPTILNSLGLVEMRLYDFENSENYFLQAIKADSNYLKAYNNLGLSYYYSGDYLKAINILKVPDMSSANEHELRSNYYHMFMAYTGLTDCDSAIKYYKLARRINTNELVLENLELFKREVFSKNCP
jgi:tetratricopeptide (TPR) repeat protein